MKTATVIRLRPDRSHETVDLTDTMAACRLLQRELFSSGVHSFELAKQTGLANATVSKIAYGETKQPRFNTVVVLLRALGWSVLASR